MARIRHERARVRDHTDETREQAEIGQRVHLPLHAFLLVEKPPARTELNFSGNRAVLEISNHRGEGVIVRRIQIVNDCLGQRIFRIKFVQICRECGTLRPVADGIKTCVRAELFEQARVVAAQCAKVKLLRPAALRVEMTEEQHQVGGKLAVFLRGDGFVAPGFVEYLRGDFLRTKICEAMIHAVVGQAAAL